MLALDAITDFLSQWEGVEEQGYVPCKRRNFTGLDGVYEAAVYGPVLGQSGVTVGMGVDLGQQDAAGLTVAGVAPDLLAELAPYLGKRKTAAITALAARPLRISPDQVAALDRAMIGRYLAALARIYDTDASVPFADLPAQAQTVLASLYWQLGSPFAIPGWRKVWRWLKMRMWSVAAAELRARTLYQARRNAEAMLLESIRPAEA